MSQELQESREYSGSVAEGLDHYFGNAVGSVRLLHLQPELAEGPEDRARVIREQKRYFIDGVRKVIKEGKPGYGGVTVQDLREIVDLALRSDWSDTEAIRDLYRMYYKINGDELDEERLFTS